MAGAACWKQFNDVVSVGSPQFNSCVELAPASLVPFGSKNTFLMAKPQLSNAYLMQVKNGLPLAATAPGPSQLKDLPDPCASALSIPKASCTGYLPAMSMLHHHTKDHA